MPTKYDDVRDYVQRSSWRALQTLIEGVTYNQSVRRMTTAEEREALRADGFIAHDHRLTPRGETMGNFLRSNPKWRPEAPKRYQLITQVLAKFDENAKHYSDTGFTMAHAAQAGTWAAAASILREALSSPRGEPAMLVDRERLREKIAADPDLEYEVRPAHPAPATVESAKLDRWQRILAAAKEVGCDKVQFTISDAEALLAVLVEGRKGSTAPGSPRT